MRIATSIVHSDLRAAAAAARAAEIARRFGGLVDVVEESRPAPSAPRMPPDLVRDLQVLPCRFRRFEPAG